MPLGAPIGSGLGIQNQTNLRILREQITSVPLILDAGAGTASDAAIATELGFDAVLLNTAVAAAADSVAMARAMGHAVIAGRLAFEAERMGRFLYANASSPKNGLSKPDYDRVNKSVDAGIQPQMKESEEYERQNA